MDELVNLLNANKEGSLANLVNNVEWALICDGVPKDEIYEVLETDEGQARAFAKLDTIHPRHDQVGNDNIRFVFLRCFKGFRSVHCYCYIITF